MKKIIYHGNGWNLTLREFLFSIGIVLIMLAGGFFLSEKIASANDEANQEYYQAIKIDGDAGLFQYGMKTSVGNAFVSGTLEAVNPVSHSEIDGEYAYIEKITEVYTMHTKVVDDYDKDGNKIGSHVETYWEWDVVDKESMHCDSIRFLGIDFAYGTINFPGSSYIETVKVSSKVRHKFYGCDTVCEGTVYAVLKDNAVTSATFVNGADIDGAVEYMCSGGTAALVFFWIFWVVLICGAVFGFCYFDNKWLED